MSFLAGRLAGAEGSYFFQESKQAVSKMVQKNQKILNSKPNLIPDHHDHQLSSSSTADVLPEVLKHSLPSKLFHSPPDHLSGSSYSGASKWALKSDPGFSGASPDALNPLRGYVSLPQVTFGPRRWQLPNSESAVLASTANDLRQDKYTTINPDKLKAAAAGLSQIGAAFAVATTIVFGGGALVFGMAASRLEVHNTDDIRIKGKDIIGPKLETVKEQFVPLRTWAEEASKKWHFEREESVKENPLIKELSKKLGSKTPT